MFQVAEVVALLLPAVQEPVHLARQHSQPARLRLRVGADVQLVSGREDVVRVDPRLAVQPVPHDRRQVEEQRLAEQDEWDPLVVEDRLALPLLVRLRDLLFPRQVVRVAHPAVVVGELLMRAGEVDGCPAGDWRADVLPYAHQYGRHHEQHYRVLRAESVGEIIVSRRAGFRPRDEHSHDLIHVGCSQ